MIRTSVFFLIPLLVSVFWMPSLRAEDAPILPTTLLGPAPPYVPRATEYSFELGLTHATDELVWVAGQTGFNVGSCVFSDSHTCQNYVDFIAGASLREGETRSHLLTSLRWQYVNLPDRHSPFYRVFAGGMHVARPGEEGWRGTAGVGFGVTSYLHDKVDLRLEARFGQADVFYVQGLAGLQIKVDRLLQEFASRLRDLGIGTVSTAIEATGTAIQATEEGFEGIVDEVSKPLGPLQKKEPRTIPQNDSKNDSKNNSKSDSRRK